MKIRILAVGRTRPPLNEPVRAYEARAGRYWKLEVEEVEAGAGRGRAAPEEVRRAEGERILARVPGDWDLWLLTRTGERLSSRELARLLGERGLHALPPVVICIGGAFGVSEAVEERSVRRLSLSAMTLAHELARLVLAEQLYRAGTILRNEPYHKEREVAGGIPV
jgi:23S rRNA (pseudouridine1915-N3)-methyltransferase